MLELWIKEQWVLLTAEPSLKILWINILKSFSQWNLFFPKEEPVYCVSGECSAWPQKVQMAQVFTADVSDSVLWLVWYPTHTHTHTHTHTCLLLCVSSSVQEPQTPIAPYLQVQHHLCGPLGVVKLTPGIPVSLRAVWCQTPPLSSAPDLPYCLQELPQSWLLKELLIHNWVDK